MDVRLFDSETGGVSGHVRKLGGTDFGYLRFGYFPHLFYLLRLLVIPVQAPTFRDLVNHMSPINPGIHTLQKRNHGVTKTMAESILSMSMT